MSLGSGYGAGKRSQGRETEKQGIEWKNFYKLLPPEILLIVGLVTFVLGILLAAGYWG